MIPSDELDELGLSDGGKIIASVSHDAGIRAVRFDAESHELARLELGYPSRGFGGGGWVISPSGGLLVLHYYSGQSEETFVLLDLSNGGMKRVASPEYQFGEFASYAFSPDEAKLIMALPQTCVEWWVNWEDEGLEEAEDGVEVLPFATLLLCSTSSGEIHRTEIELVPTVARPIHRDEYDPDLGPQLFANSVLSIRLPWASVKVDLSNTPSCVRVPYPGQSAS